MIQLHHGDCLEVMKQIPDASIDLVLTDPPYGTTKNKWDSAINLSDLWSQLSRITKPRSAAVIFAQTPFDKILGASNIAELKYEWIWEKEQGTGHLNSKFCPMKKHENILVFSKSAASFVRNPDDAMLYFPQMSEGKAYTTTKGSLSSNYDAKNDKIVTTVNEGFRYPTSVLKFQRDKEKLHPTQKPVALNEYLVQTYTSKGQTVLDCFMGSGTAGVACRNLGRAFIGIEKDENYFNIAKKRIENGESCYQADLF